MASLTRETTGFDNQTRDMCIPQPPPLLIGPQHKVDASF